MSFRLLWILPRFLNVLKWREIAFESLQTLHLIGFLSRYCLITAQ